MSSLDTILSIAAPMIEPHLKPEHKKWLRSQWLDNRTIQPEVRAMGEQAYNAAHAHPEVLAAKKVAYDAMDKADSLRKTGPDSPEYIAAIENYQPLMEKHHDAYTRRFAEHLGTLIDQHIATAPEREQKERVDKARAEGETYPIVKKRNGKFVAGCLKCNGSGTIPRFGNVSDGVCFGCNGVGFNPKDEEHDSHESLRKRLVDSRVARAQEPIIPRNTTASPAEAAPAHTERPKGFVNKFPGNCVGCNTRVGTGEGMTSRSNGGWEVRCVGCHHG
jgi:hypothetical protein